MDEAMQDSPVTHRQNEESDEVELLIEGASGADFANDGKIHEAMEASAVPDKQNEEYVEAKVLAVKH